MLTGISFGDSALLVDIKRVVAKVDPDLEDAETARP
jgi:hypothetical protein